MNERIRELAEQALDIVSNKRMLKDGQLERTWDPHEYDHVFAELIVRECARIIESQDVDPAFRHRMTWAMKEKFGVEQ